MRTPHPSRELVLCVHMRDLVATLDIVLAAERADDAPVAILETGEEPRTRIVCKKSVRHGVRVGMSQREAKRRCPALRFVSEGDRSAGSVARVLAKHLATFSPAVEPEGDDSIVVHLVHACGPTAARRVAQWVSARIGSRFGRRPRIGIGPNVLVARMAARTADSGGIVELDAARYREAVGAWRVRELPGVTPRVERRLWTRGVFTIGQLALADEESLGLGVAGRVLCERARGREPRSAIELVPVAATYAGARALEAGESGRSHGAPSVGRESAAAIERLISGTFGARVRARLLREGHTGEWKVLPIEALRRTA